MNLELYLESFTELNLNGSNEWIQMNVKPTTEKNK